MRARCAVPLLLLAVFACNDTRVPADADAGAATDAGVGGDAFDGDATYELFQPGAGETLPCDGGWCALRFADWCGETTLYESLDELLVVPVTWVPPGPVECFGVTFPTVVTDLTAACVGGTCVGVDLRASDWRVCVTDDDCTTVDNTCCRCERQSSGTTRYIGIRRDRADEFRSLVCSPLVEEDCPCREDVAATLERVDVVSPARCWHGVCRSAGEVSAAERYGIPTEP